MGSHAGTPIVIVKSRDAARTGLEASVTPAVNEYVPAAFGLPERAPVAERMTFGGSEPLVTAKA